MRIRDEYLHGSDLLGVIKGLKWEGNVLKFSRAVGGTESFTSVGTIPTWNQDTTGKAAKAGNADTVTNGVYTTGEQTISGAKTFSNVLTLYKEGGTNADTNAQITFTSKNTTTGKSSQTTITSYHGNENGSNLVINPNGNIVIGSGEAAASFYNNKLIDNTGEVFYLLSDNDIYLETNSQTLANRVGFHIDNSGNIIPTKAEVDTNNFGSLGTSTYKLASVYATTFTGNLTGNVTGNVTGNLTGVASKATADSDGLPINTTYLKLSGGTLTGTLTVPSLQVNGTANFDQTITGSISGNAGTATALLTARKINGVSFNGTSDITITANPNSHTHGNITNAGAIGTTAGYTVYTGENGVLNATSILSFDTTNSYATVSGLLQVTNNGNTATIGSLNASFFHIYNSADIPFIFNNSVLTINGGLGSSAHPFDYLYLSTTASKWGKLVPPTLTDNRTWTMPDKTGTVALTSDILNPTSYKWANLSVLSSTAYNTAPEFASVKVGNGTTAAGSGCTMSYDSTNKCVKFVFA